VTTPTRTPPPVPPVPPPEPLSPALVALTAAAAAQLAPVWRLPPADIGTALFDILPALIDEWGNAAASVAADWYDELRASQEIRGRFTALVKPLERPGAESLAGWGAEPLRAPQPELLVPTPEPGLDPVEAARYRVEGGLQKRLVNSANLTITDNTAEDPQAHGYMRRTRPSPSYPAGCKFCIMVASRGAVYTRASATFACHENCYCEAVPAWGGQPLPVRPYKRSDRPMSSEDRARVRKWIADNL
jgi:hypothetical protein